MQSVSPPSLGTLRVSGPNSTLSQRRCFTAAGSRSRRLQRPFHGVHLVNAAAGPTPPYNVVITGSTKGVGRALAETFLAAGDNVCVSSRSDARVSETVKALQAAGKQRGGTCGTVKGVSANVAKPADVEQLAKFAAQNFGSIDLWICNAGSNAYNYVPLAENNVQDLISIVETNTLGTMLCCREAIRVMRQQPTGGHIFLMDGAGADGGATPRFAAYGSTKRGLAQFQKSISAELKLQKLDKVVVHNLSPGMVTTELLMAGVDSSKVSRFFINCLAEEPRDVAEYLVPMVRRVPQESGGKATYIRALTKPKAYTQIAQRLLTGARKGRFVPED